MALLSSVALTLATSLVVCVGASPLLFERADGVAPLLGVAIGARVAARGKARWAGARVALVFVILWLGFWLYLMDRWNPLLWCEDGLPRLTLAHLGWWGATIIAGIAGGMAGKLPGLVCGFAAAIIYAGALLPGVWERGDAGEILAPQPDGTMAWLHAFHFSGGEAMAAGVYDCDSEGKRAFEDVNTSFLGEDFAALTHRLDGDPARRQLHLLCLVNGGFFGASGWSVAHHEEPMVEDGRALYDADLLRPKDQAWFFAINSPKAVLAGQPRFSMQASIPWNQLASFQAVLGGVRPLRYEGRSVELKPGAGATGLKCSRTSVGWSADGSEFYVLTVFDPDGELASQLQRRSGRQQTGGWDVTDVQKFWEGRGVPYAVLFDGGESTQLAARRGDGSYFILPSGYQYSFTLGYFRERPLRFTLPILPPSEAHRGVLNYFYVAGPAEPS